MIKKKKKKNFLKKINIKAKDLEINPIVGGTPANDKKTNIIENEKNCILLKYFKSFKVVIFFTSKIKITEKKTKFK